MIKYHIILVGVVVKFRVICCFIFFIFQLSYGYSNEQILKTINSVSKKQQISARILYTIVKIESDFDPFAISFLTDRQNALYFKKLDSSKARVNIGSYSLNRKKWFVNISPQTEEYAKAIAKELLKSGFSIDVGLGQINSYNFTKDELKQIFNPQYNLQKAAKVLRECYNAKNKELEKTIECYNYGMRNRNSNPYYRRFYKHYLKTFSN